MYWLSAWILELSCESLNLDIFIYPQTIYLTFLYLSFPILKCKQQQYLFHRVIVRMKSKMVLKSCLARGKWLISINCQIQHDQRLCNRFINNIQKNLKTNSLKHKSSFKVGIGLLALFVNKILLEHSNAHLFTCYLWLLSGRVEQLQQS